MLRLCSFIIVGCLLLRSSLVSVLPPAAIEFLTPFRIDTLAFGALVCLISRNVDWSARFRKHSQFILAGAGLGLAGLVLFAGAVSIDHVAIRTVGYTLFAALYASVVFRAAAASGTSGTFVSLLRTPFSGPSEIQLRYLHHSHADLHHHPSSANASR